MGRSRSQQISAVILFPPPNPTASASPRHVVPSAHMKRPSGRLLPHTYLIIARVLVDDPPHTGGEALAVAAGV